MTTQRSETIGDVKVEEFCWNGKAVVYVNNQKFHGTFEEACNDVRTGEIK